MGDPLTTDGAWRSPVAHLLWEGLSGVGGRRPASEMLDFCVSCVGERRWVTTQFLAQFEIGPGDGVVGDERGSDSTAPLRQSHSLAQGQIAGMVVQPCGNG